MSSNDDSPSILLVSFRYPPETGAAATRLEALTTRWADRDHNVTVLTPTPDYPDGEVYDGYRNAWLHCEERDGVNVVTTKSIPASPTDYILRRAAKYVWFTLFATIVGVLWLNRRDVVVATSPQPFAGLAGITIARLRGVPFVFEIRDLWPESLVAMGQLDTPVLVTVLYRMTDFLYAHADRIAITAPGMQEIVVDAGADPDHVWLQTNGIDHTEFDPESADEIHDAELFEDRFVLSYVGTIGRAQGLEVVLNVADRLNETGYNDVLFAFIGFGSRYDELSRRADERGLDNVVFLGRRPKSEVPNYLHASDGAFIHTESDEVFETMIPMKLYEALGAGLPVVLGASGDAVEILDRADAGIAVTPGDADAIIDAVQQLRDDPERCREYGENGCRYVVENHSWDALATTYSDNITQLVEEHEPRFPRLRRYL
jgi:glycosyltransferase involved in cell wall biosynthesis